MLYVLVIVENKEIVFDIDVYSKYIVELNRNMYCLWNSYISIIVGGFLIWFRCNYLCKDIN